MLSDDEEILALSQMSNVEVIAFQLANKDEGEMNRLLSQMRAHLIEWGVAS